MLPEHGALASVQAFLVSSATSLLRAQVSPRCIPPSADVSLQVLLPQGQLLSSDPTARTLYNISDCPRSLKRPSRLPNAASSPQRSSMPVNGLLPAGDGVAGGSGRRINPKASQIAICVTIQFSAPETCFIRCEVFFFNSRCQGA